MKATELINALSALIEAHGDQDVFTGLELDYREVEETGVQRKNKRGDFTNKPDGAVDHFVVN